MIELGIYFVLSIGFSFLCSILEAVLLSVTPSYIRREQQAGTATGKLLAEYKEDIDRPLSAILTLNTIAHTIGAIMVGAKAGELFGNTAALDLGGFSLSYEAIVATVMTLLILVVSEIIPKTIGANNWQMLSPFTVKTIRIFIVLLYPLVWLSQLITRSLKNDKEKAVLTRADILLMTEMGSNKGVLAEEESSIIQNVLSFEKLIIRDIMTPRSVTFMVDEATTVEEYLALDGVMSYSRVPIYAGEKDGVTGLVLKDDVLEAKANGKGDIRISELKRDMQTVSDGMPLPAFLRLTSKDKNHIHLVKDEFGHVLGVVSMEDLIETLLGTEIIDETDEVIDLQAHARTQWSEKNED